MKKKMPKFVKKSEVISAIGTSKARCIDIEKIKSIIKAQWIKFQRFLKKPTGFIIGIFK